MVVYVMAVVVQDTMQRFPYEPFRKHNHKSMRKHTELDGELLQWQLLTK